MQFCSMSLCTGPSISLWVTAYSPRPYSDTLKLNKLVQILKDFYISLIRNKKILNDVSELDANLAHVTRQAADAQKLSKAIWIIN